LQEAQSIQAFHFFSKAFAKIESHFQTAIGISSTSERMLGLVFDSDFDVDQPIDLLMFYSK